MKTTLKAELKSSIDVVWNVVTDNHEFSWRSDLKSIIVHDAKNFTEIDHGGYEVNFEITEFVPNTYYAFNMRSKNTFGKWSGKFYETEGGGTIVELTEDVSTNNIFMKPFLKRFLKKHQQNYLHDLRMVLSE